MEDIFHEIHITVDHKDSFEEDCKNLNVKPIIIEMSSKIPTHSMTSSTLKNMSDRDVMINAQALGDSLKSLGYDVQRIKIETVPWHPMAQIPSNFQYFEAHFAVEGFISDENLKKLKLHKSRNLLKKSTGSVQMLTFRIYNINDSIFKEVVDNLILKLEGLNVKVIKTIREFAIYDSNTSLDNQWLAL